MCAGKDPGLHPSLGEPLPSQVSLQRSERHEFSRSRTDDGQRAGICLRPVGIQRSEKRAEKLAGVVRVAPEPERMPDVDLPRLPATRAKAVPPGNGLAPQAPARDSESVAEEVIIDNPIGKVSQQMKECRAGCWTGPGPLQGASSRSSPASTPLLQQTVIAAPSRRR